MIELVQGYDSVKFFDTISCKKLNNMGNSFVYFIIWEINLEQHYDNISFLNKLWILKAIMINYKLISRLSNNIIIGNKLIYNISL